MPLRDIDYQLLDAARAGDLPGLQAALDKGANTSANDDRPGSNGETAMHLACANGHPPSIELLLKRYVDVRVKDNNGRLPVHYAVSKGQIGVVKLLLDRHSYDSLSAEDNQFTTPLFLAVQDGYVEMAMFLLDKGALFTQGCSGYAIKDKHSFYAKLLGEIITCNIRQVEWRLNTRLTYVNTYPLLTTDGTAVSRKILNPYDNHEHRTKYERCEMLKCALYFAVIKGYPPIFQRLINAYITYVDHFIADIEHRYESDPCNKFKTLVNALRLSVQSGCLDGVISILQNIPSLEKPSVDYGSVHELYQLKHIGLFKALCTASANGHVEIADLLLKSHAPFEIDRKELSREYREGLDDQKLPLFLAAQNGHVPMVAFLLQAGAARNEPIAPNANHDIKEAYNLKCYRLFSVLCVASEKGYLEIVELLLQNGASFEKPWEYSMFSQGRPYWSDNPLVLAAKNGYVALVTSLLKSYDLYIQQCDGDTGQKPGYKETILTNRDKAIFDSLRAAVEQNHFNVLTLLLRYYEALELQPAWKDTYRYSEFSQATEPAPQPIEEGLSKQKKAQLFQLLCLASEKGYADIVELFLQHGVPCELKQEDRSVSYGGYYCHGTPFLSAVQRGHVKVIALLEEAHTKEAQKLYSEGKGDVALCSAIENGQGNIAEWLLAQQNPALDINKPICGQYPLIKAVSLNRLDILTLMTSHGATFDVTHDAGDTILHIAVNKSYEKMTMIQFILAQKKLAVDIVNRAGITPLVSAIKDRKEQATELLLAEGAAIGQKIDGAVDLYFAIKNSDSKMLEVLVSAYKMRGAPIDAPDQSGITPLAYALKETKSECAKVLFNAGATVGQKIEGLVDLHFIVSQKAKQQYSSYELSNILQVLLEAYKSQGTPVDLKSDNGMTPLVYAVKEGLVEEAKKLLEAGAAVGQIIEGLRDLKFIISQRNLGGAPFYYGRESYKSIEMLEVCVKAYVEQGLSVDIVNDGRETPLLYAIQKGNPKAVEILLNAGAAIGQIRQITHEPQAALLDDEELEEVISDLQSGKLAASLSLETKTITIPERVCVSKLIDLHVAALTDNDTFKILAKAYNKSGLSIDVRDENSKTPLIKICSCGRTVTADFIKFLKDMKSDLNAVDNDGRTAISYACIADSKSTLALAEGGADINKADKDGVTPFTHAMLANKQNIQRYIGLIDIGASPDIAGKDGVTAIIYAFQQAWYSVVNTFLIRGANPYIKDNAGQDLVDHALSMPASSELNNFVKALAFREAAVGHEEILRKILVSGFNPNATNDLGQSLLYVACYNRHSKVVDLLLEFRANPNLGWVSEDVAPAMAIAGEYGMAQKNAASIYCCPGVFLSDHANKQGDLKARAQILHSLIHAGADLTKHNKVGLNAYSIAHHNYIGNIFKETLQHCVTQKIMPEEMALKALSIKPVPDLPSKIGKFSVSFVLYEAGIAPNPMPLSDIRHMFSEDSEDMSLNTLIESGFLFYLNHPEYMSENFLEIFNSYVGPLFIQELINRPKSEGNVLKAQLTALMGVLPKSAPKIYGGKGRRGAHLSAQIPQDDNLRKVRRIITDYNPKKIQNDKIIHPISDKSSCSESDAISKSASELSANLLTGSESTGHKTDCNSLVSLSSSTSVVSGIVTKDVWHDGNCFFYAVGEQLAKISDIGESSMNIFELRRFAVNYVNAHREDFKDFILDESPEQYISRIERNNQWADHVLIKALALELQINIIILEPTGHGNLKAPIIVTRDDAKFARTIFLYHIPELHYKSIDSIDIAKLQYTLDILRARGIEVPEILVYHDVPSEAHVDSVCLVSSSASSSSFCSSSSSSSFKTPVKSIVCCVTDIQYDNHILNYNYKHEGKLFTAAKEIGGTELVLLLMEVGANKALAMQIISAIEAEGAEKFLQALIDSLKKQQEQQDFEKALNIASNVQTDEGSNVGFYTIIKQFAEDISSSWSMAAWAPNLLKTIEEWLNWDRDETDASIAKTCQLLDIASLLTSGAEMPVPYGGHGPNDPDDGSGGYGGDASNNNANDMHEQSLAPLTGCHSTNYTNTEAGHL